MIELKTEHTIEPGLTPVKTELAISQAISSIADVQNGGIINLRPATYQTDNSIVIKEAGIKIKGNSSQWWINNSVGPSISLGEHDYCTSDGEISGIKFLAGTSKVSGPVILANVGQYVLRDLIFSGWNDSHKFVDGIHFVSNRDDKEPKGSPYQWTVRVKDVDLYGGKSTGSALIYDEGVFDISLENLTIGGWLHSIDARHCSAIYHKDVETTASIGNDINIVVEDGKWVRDMFFNNVIPDWGYGHGYNLITNGSGVINTVYIEGGWIGSRGAEPGTGKIIQRSHGIYANAPNLYGLYILAGRQIKWNNGHGICVLNGRKIRIINQNIHSNGVWELQHPNGIPNMGIFIGGRAREIDILGCNIGSSDNPNGQTYGICIDNEVDEYNIQMNTIRGNLKGAIMHPARKSYLVANNFTD